MFMSAFSSRDVPGALRSNMCCDLFVLQLDMTFHLFICALAGAGAAVIAMVRQQQHLRLSRDEKSKQNENIF